MPDNMSPDNPISIENTVKTPNKYASRSRRSFLKVGGSLGLLAVLAACSPDILLTQPVEGSGIIPTDKPATYTPEVTATEKAPSSMTKNDVYTALKEKFGGGMKIGDNKFLMSAVEMEPLDESNPDVYTMEPETRQGRGEQYAIVFTHAVTENSGEVVLPTLIRTKENTTKVLGALQIADQKCDGMKLVTSYSVFDLNESKEFVKNNAVELTTSGTLAFDETGNITGISNSNISINEGGVFSNLVIEIQKNLNPDKDMTIKALFKEIPNTGTSENMLTYSAGEIFGEMKVLLGEDEIGMYSIEDGVGSFIVITLEDSKAEKGNIIMTSIDKLVKPVNKRGIYSITDSEQNNYYLNGNHEWVLGKEGPRVELNSLSKEEDMLAGEQVRELVKNVEQDLQAGVNGIKPNLDIMESPYGEVIPTAKIESNIGQKNIDLVVSMERHPSFKNGMVPVLRDRVSGEVVIRSGGKWGAPGNSEVEKPTTDLNYVYCPNEVLSAPVIVEPEVETPDGLKKLNTNYVSHITSLGYRVGYDMSSNGLENAYVFARGKQMVLTSSPYHTLYSIMATMPVNPATEMLNLIHPDRNILRKIDEPFVMDENWLNKMWAEGHIRLSGSWDPIAEGRKEVGEINTCMLETYINLENAIPGMGRLFSRLEDMREGINYPFQLFFVPISSPGKAKPATSGDRRSLTIDMEEFTKDHNYGISLLVHELIHSMQSDIDYAGSRLSIEGMSDILQALYLNRLGELYKHATLVNEIRSGNSTRK